MNRKSLTEYDEYPEAMLTYLRLYGPHFNKKLCEFAARYMSKIGTDGKERKIVPYDKSKIDQLIAAYGVSIENAQLYDSVYVANMCKADFLGTSILDERHLVLYVKDVLDDIDAPDGLVFNRFYADCCYKGIVIDWEEML